MFALRSLFVLVASSLLALQVSAAAHAHQHHHQHHVERDVNSTIEARYSLPYPYNPWSTLKRGLPFNNPSKYIQTFKGAGSKVAWAYNWDSFMDSTFPGNVEFVPMLWGDGADHTTNVSTHLAIRLDWDPD